MSGKQHKRELKRQKEAARQERRRKERQRTMVTVAIIAVVVAIGGALVGITWAEERAAEAQARREAEERSSELAAEASEQAEAIANRDVACDAEEPSAAGGDKPTFEAPGNVLEEGTDYRAVIETSCGTVRIDLAEEQAPEAVNSFAFLAAQDFYEGLEIFRNARNIGILQTGSGTNEPAFQIGYTLNDELAFAQEEGYPPGAVAMANAGPNSAGSQFFFVYNTSFNLDPTFTRFGTVTEGLNVLQAIGALPTIGPQEETPGEAVYIESVRIVPRPETPQPQTQESPAPGETSPAPARTTPAQPSPSPQPSASPTS